MGNVPTSFNVEQQGIGAAMTEPKNARPDTPKTITAAAERALAEAESRRKIYQAREAAMPSEHGGRSGKEPVRYGDWEVKGLATDF